MKVERKIISIILLIIIAKFLFVILGLSNKYYDIFIPIIPFATLLNSNTLIILFYIITATASSIIHYDETFVVGLGYGISLLILIRFSRKYSLTNIFNYLLSVLTISVIVFFCMVLVYLAKDELVVMRDFSQFVSMNLVIAIFYYILYRILISRAYEYVKG